MIKRCPREAPDRQEAPKRRPRASQTPPKWSPRPSQIHFLKHFFAMQNLHWIFIVFSIFFHDFLKLEPLILLIFPRENAIFYEITIFKRNAKKHRKMFQKSFKIDPNFFQNQAKIDLKSEKIAPNRYFRLTYPIKSKKCTKIAKNEPTWANVELQDALGPPPRRYTRTPLSTP